MKAFTSFRAEEVKLIQQRSHCSGTDFTKDWRTGGLGVPVSLQGQRVLHLMQGDGFVTLQFLLLHSDIPTSAWQSYRGKPGHFHEEPSGKGNFWSVGISNILKFAFLPHINERPKFHGLCGMDLLERKRGKEWRRWRNFLLKGKEKSCWYCFGELCHFLIFMGTDPNSREDSKSAAHRESARAAWKTNKQLMISQKLSDKEVIFKLVIHFKQFT